MSAEFNILHILKHVLKDTTHRVDATNIVVTDTVPSEMTFTSGGANAGWAGTTAAASAEPPPMPAATGRFLVRRMWSRRPEPAIARLAARRTRLSAAFSSARGPANCICRQC